MQSNNFQYLSFTIHYRVTGRGVPLVLLHGFGEDGTVWDEQVAYLAGKAMVIVPDLPGSGASILKKENFTEENKGLLNKIEFYADVVNGLLQHLKIETCILLGHSMGGYITLAFAEKYPTLVKGFGLIHSTAYADNAERKEKRDKGIAMMEEHGGYAFLKASTPNLFTTLFKQKYPERVFALIERAKGFDTEALQCYYRAMRDRPDRVLVLKESKVPVLIVAGQEDIVVPLDDLLQQSHIANTTYFHILENAAHMGMWEAREELNKAIGNFVEEIKL
ncbi:alpha/beta fold hydrolase [Parasediminibacterium sp. JCM 36343]|uniref:alpha/beta fold hydrolase n=1 Tax=Parasediminibacterium sp. JCM 36343 TaxID=3374279 RepID=UPI003979CCFE